MFLWFVDWFVYDLARLIIVLSIVDLSLMLLGSNGNITGLDRKEEQQTCRDVFLSTSMCFNASFVIFVIPSYQHL